MSLHNNIMFSINSWILQLQPDKKGDAIFQQIHRQSGFYAQFNRISICRISCIFLLVICFVSHRAHQGTLLRLVSFRSGCVVRVILTMLLRTSCWLSCSQCRLQADNRYKSPIECTIQTIKSDGVCFVLQTSANGEYNGLSNRFPTQFTGLFRGLSGTLLREMPGSFAYFGAYEVSSLTGPNSPFNLQKLISSDTHTL